MQLVQSFLTSEEWAYIFPDSISLYSYDAFLQSVGEFPKFCGEGTMDPDGTYLTACKRELATLLAHMIRETGLNDNASFTPAWRQGLHWITELACTPPESPPDTKCDYSTTPEEWASNAWPPVEG